MTVSALALVNITIILCKYYQKTPLDMTNARRVYKQTLFFSRVQMYNIKDFTPRLYQETILHTATMKNVLVVLPTGMGKTKTAMLIAIHRLNNYPNSKIFFLTPTKPLASQICEEFKKNTDIDESKIVLFTGTVSPEKREDMWKNATVIVSTPQTAANDLVNNRISVKDVSCLVIDEAHLAVGDYDYNFVAKQYHKMANYPKIIALTASPGSDLAKIAEVCTNLHIEEIEVRTSDDPDVKPYVQELDIKYVLVDLPESFKDVKKYLADCLKTKMNKIKEFGYATSGHTPSKTELLGIQRELQKKIATGEKDFSIWGAISMVAEAIKVQYAIELLETQGISALDTYMSKIFEEAGKAKSKATKNLSIDINFKSAYVKTRHLVEEDIEHPKLTKLKEIVSAEIKSKDDAKVIVFTQYRESATKLAKELNSLEKVKAKIFVGQTKKGDTGMSQKEQIEMLDRFREGEFNAIVMTSVGELGLDIPSVDLVTFYEPVPSAIRQIQRRGRTARHEKGAVKILVTKNTIDEAYRWTAHHKEKRMYSTLKDIKDKLKSDFLKPKQPTLNDFAEQKEDVMMYVDSREKGTNLVKELVEKGVKVRLQNLLTADFVISEHIGVERKTKVDFVNSIVDKRILNQVKELKNNFAYPLLLIEGMEDIYSIRNIHPNAIRGMLATIALSFGVPIVYTKDYKDTVEFLTLVAKRAQEEGKKEFSLRQDRKPLTTKELQEFIVESLPGVGPTLAKSLLKKLKTVKNVINAEVDSLKNVDKIGDKKAEEIKRVVEEEYKEF